MLQLCKRKSFNLSNYVAYLYLHYVQNYGLKKM